MTPLEMCAQTLKNTESVVNQVRLDQLSKPTPCSDWDVRTLLNHMVSTLNALQAPARGEPMTFSAQKVEDVIGPDPAETFATTVTDFIAAWSVPGATERVVTTGFGEQPAAFYLTLAMGDMLVHGWDVATAIAAPYTMDEEAAAIMLAGMQRMLKPEMRGTGKAFAEEVPAEPNASVQERLLAFSGRRAQ